MSPAVSHAQSACPIAGSIAVCASIRRLLPFLLVFGLGCSSPNDDRVVVGSAGPAAVTGPAAPNQYWFAQRVDESGQFQPGARSLALGEKGSLLRGLLEPEWQLVGPTNIGGRITEVVGDPSDPNRFFVASAGGGLFRTLDGGATFESVFDGYGSPAIGAVAISSSDPQVIYVGTGEANPGGGNAAYPGDGVWKSLDGGDSFFSVGLEKTVSIGRVAIDPLAPNVVFVAAAGNLHGEDNDRGLYRSRDGGTSWEQVLTGSLRTGAIDVAIDPLDSNRIYAALWQRFRSLDSKEFGGPNSGLLRSDDGGDSWTLLGEGLPDSQTLAPGRIGVAIAPSDPSSVYASFTNSDSSFEGLYRSIDSGATWQKLPAAGIDESFCRSFCYWFGRLAVDPEDAEEVWLSGIGLYRSQDGGLSFSPILGMHVDHHSQFFFRGDESSILAATDGGLYRSVDDGTSWQHFDNLPITQHYAFDVFDFNPETLYAGSQDNGTHRRDYGASDSFSVVVGGDGFTVQIAPDDPSVVLAESQWGDLHRSTNGGVSFEPIAPADVERANWHAPFVLDPSDSETIYFGGSRLWRAEDVISGFEPDWKVLSEDLTNGDAGTGVVLGTITAIAVAPTNRDTLYVGTDDGNLWRSLDWGATFEVVNAGLPRRWVTSIEVDPSNDARVLVTFSGYRSNDTLAHVFESLNFGQNWQDISGDLPNAPVQDILIDPEQTDRLYLASDIGVFVSDNGGENWRTLGDGLPDVVATQLELVDRWGERDLFVSTFGRSLWSLRLAESQRKVYADDLSPIGYSGNDGLELFDGDWTEEGDDGLPSRGDIRVTTSAFACGAAPPCVEITAAEGDERLTRAADLSGIVSALFEVNFTVEGGDSGVDVVFDDGTSVVTAGTLTADQGARVTTARFEISDFVALNSDFEVRFEATASNGARTYVDDISIVGELAQNEAPSIVDPGPQSSRVGESVLLSIDVSDPEGDALQFSASGLPEGLALDQDASAISGEATEAGTYLVTLAVSDGRVVTTASFEWLVVDALTFELLNDSFETDLGWKIDPFGTDTAPIGNFERGRPELTSGEISFQLAGGRTGEYALVTGAAAGDSSPAFDLDLGNTSALSPPVALPDRGDLELLASYSFAHRGGSEEDSLRISVLTEGDEGRNDLLFEQLGKRGIYGAEWIDASWSLTPWAGKTVRLLIEADDAARNNRLEVVIDDVVIRWTTDERTNLPPTVTAMANLELDGPAAAILTALVEDDGRPIVPGVVDLIWSQTSGPGKVFFRHFGTGTAASFPIAGEYVIAATASDGELASTAYVQVLVRED